MGPRVSANRTPRSRTLYSFAVLRRSVAISANFGEGSLEVFEDLSGDVGIRDWVSVPFHLIEMISRLCCSVHFRIWNGTKERSTDTAAA